MTRRAFLIVAGVLPVLFGLTMIFDGSQMLDMVTVPTHESAVIALQWMGCPLIAIGLMNIMASRDPGSVALRAIFIGNIVVHALGMVVDVYQYSGGVMKTSGLVFGAVLHLGLAAAFAFYYTRLPKVSLRLAGRLDSLDPTMASSSSGSEASRCACLGAEPASAEAP